MKFKIIPNEQTPRTTDAVDIINDRKLMEKFLSFASRQYNCAGLAANQVSCDQQRIMKPFFAIKIDHFWDIVINPTIKEYNGEPSEKIEGCLTWLGKDILVMRYPKIIVSYYTLNGEYFAHRTISGWEAQVWQHEYNHLMGIEENVISRRK